MKERKQFTFYRSFYRAMEHLSMLDRGRAVTMLCDYAFFGIEPERPRGRLAIFYDLVSPVLATGRKKALAGQLGASVTNQKCAGKKETEAEIEAEKEIETEAETEDEDASLLRSRFLRFWDLYPVKVGKEQAWQVWKQLNPDEQTVCGAVRQWSRSELWTERGGRFIPRAAKFLEERYYAHLPGDAGPVGARGELGQAEIEAIRGVMGADF